MHHGTQTRWTRFFVVTWFPLWFLNFSLLETVVKYYSYEKIKCYIKDLCKPIGIWVFRLNMLPRVKFCNDLTASPDLHNLPRWAFVGVGGSKSVLFSIHQREKNYYLFCLFRKTNTIGSTLSDQTQVTKVITTPKRFKKSQFRADSWKCSLN